MQETSSPWLLNVHAQTSSRAEPVEIWKARSFIRDHLADEISLRMVADTVHLSPNYFSEQFKRFTGINFVEYIARLRIEKARELLRESDLRVTEIAFAVGFQSLSQFNRVFRRFSGKSPTKFRATECSASKLNFLPGANRQKSGKTLAEEMRSRPSAISDTLRRDEGHAGHDTAPRCP